MDVLVTSSRHRSAKVLSTTGSNYLATYLLCHVTYRSTEAWHTLNAMLASDYD